MTWKPKFATRRNYSITPKPFNSEKHFGNEIQMLFLLLKHYTTHYTNKSDQSFPFRSKQTHTSSTSDWHARNSFSCCSNSVRRFNKALNSSETTSPKPVFAHLCVSKVYIITEYVIISKQITSAWNDTNIYFDNKLMDITCKQMRNEDKIYYIFFPFSIFFLLYIFYVSFKADVV